MASHDRGKSTQRPDPLGNDAGGDSRGDGQSPAPAELPVGPSAAHSERYEGVRPVQDQGDVGVLGIDPLVNFIEGHRKPSELYGNPHDRARVKFPLVWGLMTRRVLPSGKLKELATLKFAAVPNGVRATLTDTDMGKEWSLTVESLEGALEGLEAALNDPTQRYVREIRYGEGWKNTKAEERKALDRVKAKS